MEDRGDGIGFGDGTRIRTRQSRPVARFIGRFDGEIVGGSRRQAVDGHRLGEARPFGGRRRTGHRGAAPGRLVGDRRGAVAHFVAVGLAGGVAVVAGGGPGQIDGTDFAAGAGAQVGDRRRRQAVAVPAPGELAVGVAVDVGAALQGRVVDAIDIIAAVEVEKVTAVEAVTSHIDGIGRAADGVDVVRRAIRVEIAGIGVAVGAAGVLVRHGGEGAVVLVAAGDVVADFFDVLDMRTEPFWIGIDRAAVRPEVAAGLIAVADRAARLEAVGMPVAGGAVLPVEMPDIAGDAHVEGVLVDACRLGPVVGVADLADIVRLHFVGPAVVTEIGAAVANIQETDRGTGTGEINRHRIGGTAQGATDPLDIAAAHLVAGIAVELAVLGAGLAGPPLAAMLVRGGGDAVVHHWIQAVGDGPCRLIRRVGMRRDHHLNGGVVQLPIGSSRRHGDIQGGARRSSRADHQRGAAGDAADEVGVGIAGSGDGEGIRRAGAGIIVVNGNGEIDRAVGGRIFFRTV